MRWPKLSIQNVRPSRFHPPFCPWRDCESRRGARARFHAHGSYRTKASSGRIPRFRCTCCKHTCSRQTFSTTYYLKKPHLLVAVASGLAACSAHRQIARSARCAKTSVTRMAERLGRHAILFHARCRDRLASIRESIVHDHFETRLGSKYQALGIGTAVGSDSWFVYDVDPAPHKGSGRRPDRQGEATRESFSSTYAAASSARFPGSFLEFPTVRPSHSSSTGGTTTGMRCATSAWLAASCSRYSRIQTEGRKDRLDHPRRSLETTRCSRPISSTS
jgi:transposase-like protein